MESNQKSKMKAKFRQAGGGIRDRFGTDILVIRHYLVGPKDLNTQELEKRVEIIYSSNAKEEGNTSDFNCSVDSVEQNYYEIKVRSFQPSYSLESLAKVRGEIEQAVVNIDQFGNVPESTIVETDISTENISRSGRGRQLLKNDLSIFFGMVGRDKPISPQEEAEIETSFRQYKKWDKRVDLTPVFGNSYIVDLRDTDVQLEAIIQYSEFMSNQFRDAGLKVGKLNIQARKNAFEVLM